MQLTHSSTRKGRQAGLSPDANLLGIGLHGLGKGLHGLGIGLRGLSIGLLGLGIGLHGAVRGDEAARCRALCRFFTAGGRCGPNTTVTERGRAVGHERAQPDVLLMPAYA